MTVIRIICLLVSFVLECCNHWYWIIFFWHHAGEFTHSLMLTNFSWEKAIVLCSFMRDCIEFEILRRVLDDVSETEFVQ